MDFAEVSFRQDGEGFLIDHLNCEKLTSPTTDHPQIKKINSVAFDLIVRDLLGICSCSPYLQSCSTGMLCLQFGFGVSMSASDKNR